MNRFRLWQKLRCLRTFSVPPNPVSLLLSSLFFEVRFWYTLFILRTILLRTFLRTDIIALSGDTLRQSWPVALLPAPPQVHDASFFWCAATSFPQ